MSQEGLTGDLKGFIRARALELGFHAVGFAAAGVLAEDAERVRRWCDQGFHAGLGFLERWQEVRADPGHPGMVPGARTVVSVALAYGREAPARGLARQLGAFARGPDYHGVVRGLLGRLLDEIRRAARGVRGRALVDSAPVLERAWAVRAGLGWIGRNTCLIHPELGSMLVLGELVLTAELEPDAPAPVPADPCRECRACVQACPGAALLAPDGHSLDARACLSYWTVEARARPPRDLEGRASLLFGCDACQLVCPWNGPRPGLVTPLAPLDLWSELTLEAVAALDEPDLERLLRGTALARAGAAAIRARARRLLGRLGG